MANKDLKNTKKYVRRYTICILINLLIASAVLYCIISCAVGPDSCKEKTKSMYTSNINAMNLISDYMENNGFESMYIDTDETEKGILTRDPYEGNVYIPIKPEMKKVISELQCKSISKQGNSIYYLIEVWMSTGYGVAYSMDGKKPDSGFLEKIEPIGDNWYYYEED